MLIITSTHIGTSIFLKKKKSRNVKFALTSIPLLKILYNLCSKVICTVLDDVDFFFPHINPINMHVVYHGCTIKPESTYIKDILHLKKGREK